MIKVYGQVQCVSVAGECNVSQVQCVSVAGKMSWPAVTVRKDVRNFFE